MGTRNSIQKNKLNKYMNKENKKIKKITCPFCNKDFFNINTTAINNHMKECVSPDIGKIKPCVLYPPNHDTILNGLIFNNMKEYEKNEPNKYIEKRLEDKINELKIELTEKKLLDEGSIRINLNRENLLNDILIKTENINLYKDWTIKFISEEGMDEGGLLRDFFTNIFQILEGEQLKLFVQSDSNDFSYILNPFLVQNNENFNYCKLVGLLLGKAILQNITVNICFNKLIYKMILCEKIEFEDLIFIDSQLYNSLRNLKDNIKNNEINNNINNNINIIKDLDLNYSIEMKDCYERLHSFDLIENGRNIMVENIDDFIQKKINFLLGIYEPFIKQIRDSFYKYMPIDKVKCLNSNELELILNGRPFIEIEDWKTFTEYIEPYNEKHMVIKWFWEILSELSQNELSNLLLFATGSSRVPLGGFADLESNNGLISRFTIAYIPYNYYAKNFIKAHTCFNKIDLPCFKNKNELKSAIKFVAENHIWGFGME